MIFLWFQFYASIFLAFIIGTSILEFAFQTQTDMYRAIVKTICDIHIPHEDCLNSITHMALATVYSFIRSLGCIASFSLEFTHIVLSFSLYRVCKCFANYVNSLNATATSTEAINMATTVQPHSSSVALNIYAELKHLSQNIKDIMGYCTVTYFLEFVMFFAKMNSKSVVDFETFRFLNCTAFTFTAATTLFLSAEACHQVIFGIV